jgi:toxin CptA
VSDASRTGAPGSNRHPPRLALERRPSIILAIALTLIHSAAVAAALHVLPGWYWKLGGCLAIVIHVVWVICRHALLLHPRSIVSLRFSGEDDCEAECRDLSSFAGRVQGCSYVARHLVVVRIKTGARRLRSGVVLLPDSMSSDEFRRLRVRLRWMRLGEMEASMSRTSL